MKIDSSWPVFAIVVSLIALAGCAQTTVRPEQETLAPNLPRPSIVMVHRLGVNMGEVTSDQGVYGKVVNGVDGQTASEAKAQMARDVSADFATELVRQINELGLPAQQATAGDYVPPNALVITGYFVDVDAGNKAEQLVIGFGEGESKMNAQVQVLSPSPNGYRTLLQFETRANSGEMPGAAVTMARAPRPRAASPQAWPRRMWA